MNALVSPFRPVGDLLEDTDYISNPTQTVIYFHKLVVFSTATALYAIAYNPADIHGPIGPTCMNELLDNSIILSVSKRSNTSFLCLVASVKDNDPDAMMALEAFRTQAKLQGVDMVTGGTGNDYSLEQLLLSRKMYTAYVIYSIVDTQCVLMYTVPTPQPLISAISVEGTPFIAATFLAKEDGKHAAARSFGFECLVDTDMGGKIISLRTVKQKSGDPVNFTDTSIYPALNVMADRPTTACTTPATSAKDLIKQITTRNSRTTSDVLYKLSAVHLDTTGKTVYYREYDIKSSNLRVINHPDNQKSDKHKPTDRTDYDATIDGFKPVVHYSRTLIAHSQSTIIRPSSLVLPYMQNSLFNDRFSIITEAGELHLYSRKEQADKPVASIRVFPKGVQRVFLVPLRDGMVMVASSTGDAALVGIEGRWNSDKNIEEMRCYLCKLFLDEYMAVNPDQNQQDMRDQLSAQLLPPLDVISKPVSAAKHVEKLVIVSTFSYVPTITCASTALDYKLVCLGLTKNRFAFVPIDSLKNRSLVVAYRNKIGKDVTVNTHSYHSRYSIETAMEQTVDFFAKLGVDAEKLRYHVNLFFAFSRDADNMDFLPIQEGALDSANYHNEAPGETIEMLSILASVAAADEPVGKASMAAIDQAMGKSIMNDIRETMRSTMRMITVPTVGSTAMPGEGALSLMADASIAGDAKIEQSVLTSKRVDFVEPVPAGEAPGTMELPTIEKLSLTELSAIATKSQFTAGDTALAPPVHKASGLYRTGQLGQPEGLTENMDREIEDTFRENLINATRDLLESGFNCDPIFSAAEADLKSVKESIMNISDLMKTETAAVGRIGEHALPPQSKVGAIAPQAQELFGKYPEPDSEPEHWTVTRDFLSTVWTNTVLRNVTVADAELVPSATLPVLKNLSDATMLLQHYFEMRKKNHNLERRRLIPALELLLCDDPLFLTAACSTRTPFALKNSYYRSEYTRKDHDELSQYPYSSLFTIQCNVFCLQSHGGIAQKGSSRLFSEILDAQYEMRMDPVAYTAAGIQAFLDRIYAEDFADELRYSIRGDILATVQYTQFPRRLITFVQSGKLANSFTINRSSNAGGKETQSVRYELVGTIASDCATVYRLDAIGRWSALTSGGPTPLSVSVRADDVVDNSHYAIYRQADTGSSNNIAVPLDSLSNLMMLTNELLTKKANTYSQENPETAASLLGSGHPDGAAGASTLQSEISTLKSQLEYRTRREERATEKIEILFAENHELKQRIAMLEVDLKFERNMMKSAAAQAQSQSQDMAASAAQDKHLDEILHLQTELRKREGEERILILELEEARRRLLELTRSQETADQDEYDVILKHCYILLGGSEEDVPTKRRNLILELQKKCIAVASEYNLNNPYNRDNIRLSSGPAKASQLRMSKSRADARSLVQSLGTLQISGLQDAELGNRRVISTTLLPVVCFFIGIAIIVVFAIAFNQNDVV